MMHCTTDLPYIAIDFIVDKLWVGKMRPACPTQFLACLLL